MVDTTAGLALRSTDRASPVVILGLAMFLGAGVSAVAARVRRTGLVIGGFAVAAVAGATAPLWTGGIIANGFTQPAAPPLYVRQAAAALNSSHPGTRVYALPGNNFAAYRWGDTIDTVYPGLMTRPFVTHEQQIMGSLATADLLQAVDTPLQDGTMDWNALAPMASLMSAGDVLVQYDQAYERYDTANPQQVASDLATTPAGSQRPGLLRRPEAERARSSPTSTRRPWPVRPTRDGRPRWSPTRSTDPRPVVRTESTTTPLVVDGDASGIVERRLGRSAVRQPDHPLRRHARHRRLPPEGHPGRPGRPGGHRHQPQAGLPSGTPSPRTPAYTETAAQGPDTADPADAPLNLFPKAPGRRPDHRGATAGSPRSPPRPTGPRSPTSPRTGRTAPSTATPRRPGWTTPSPRPRASGGRWSSTIRRPRARSPSSSPRPVIPTGRSRRSPSPSTAGTRSRSRSAPRP